MYKVTIFNDIESTIIHELSVNTENRLINATFNQEYNVINSFTFNIYPSNIGFNKLNDLTTLIKVDNQKTKKLEFFGRVLSIKKQMDNKGLVFHNVTCESELAFFIDSYTTYKEYANVSVEEFITDLINNHNSQVDFYKQFKVGKIEYTDNLQRQTEYQSTWECIKSRVLNIGGELVVRYVGDERYLDFIKPSTEVSNTPIQLGVNQQRLVTTLDNSEFFTRIVPLGAKLTDDDSRLTIASVNGGKIYIDNVELIQKHGVIAKVVIWDDVTIASNLFRKGNEYLANDNKQIKKFEIDAVDLSLISLDFNEFELGKYYNVINQITNVNDEVRLIKKTISLNDLHSCKLNFGDLFKTSNMIKVESNRYYEEAIKDSNKKWSELSHTAEEIKIEVGQKIDEEEAKGIISTSATEISMAINTSQGSSGVKVESSGFGVYNNDIRTILFNNGLMNLYNSITGEYMGYYGAVGNDLRIKLTGANIFSIYAGDDDLKIMSIAVDRDLKYGNATIDICGGINLTQRPGQDVGMNGLALGNDDRSDSYGYHNLFIKCHNSMGIVDNNGLTNGFYDARRGRWILKGSVYQDTNVPPKAFILDTDEASPYYSSYSNEDIVKSLLQLETTITIDSDEDVSMKILPNNDELTMTTIGSNKYVDQSSIVAGLIEVVKSLNEKIKRLEEVVK